MQNQSMAGKSNISRDSQIEQDDREQEQEQGDKEGAAVEQTFLCSTEAWKRKGNFVYATSSS